MLVNATSPLARNWCPCLWATNIIVAMWAFYIHSKLSKVKYLNWGCETPFPFSNWLFQRKLLIIIGRLLWRLWPLNPSLKLLWQFLRRIKEVMPLPKDNLGYHIWNSLHYTHEHFLSSFLALFFQIMLVNMLPLPSGCSFYCYKYVCSICDCIHHHIQHSI